MLQTILGSNLRAKALGWLFSHPDERYYVRQLTKLLNEDSTNVSRELARLGKAGVLVSTTEGRQKYYQANRQSPLFDDLHGLAVKTTGVSDVLRVALSQLAAKIAVALIFGSVARGDEQGRSDVDLMVIGAVSFAEISSALGEAEKILHRDINPVVYPAAEFREKVLAEHHFVKTVLNGDKIFVIGGEGELRRLAE
jgi:predicted nucleotidyltransferase